MSVPIVSSAATDPLLGWDGSLRVPSKTLDQDDFLSLLVTQMTTQDPLNPKADLDSIAQMAQFSSLEQTKAMQTDIALLRGQQQLLQANGMLGRTVTLQVDSETAVTGEVEAVEIVAGTPRIVVNGYSYDMSNLLQVKLAQPTE